MEALLDAIDRKILDIVQADATHPVAVTAEKVEAWRLAGDTDYQLRIVVPASRPGELPDSSVSHTDPLDPFNA